MSPARLMGDDEANPQVRALAHPVREAVGQELGDFAGRLSTAQEHSHPAAHVLLNDLESWLVHGWLLDRAMTLSVLTAHRRLNRVVVGQCRGSCWCAWR